MGFEKLGQPVDALRAVEHKGHIRTQDLENDILEIMHERAAPLDGKRNVRSG